MTQHRNTVAMFSVQTFIGLFVILSVTVTVTVAAADDAQLPHYVLVEEHHHVVSHLVEFAKKGILRSHANPETVRDEINSNGAVLIHIDSHGDMGLPPGLNHLPANLLRKDLPSTTEEAHSLIGHSLINDFLLLLGVMGIVEHIIFIEPPWSFLLKDAHHITVDISIGVVPADHNNEGGAIYASIRDSDRSPQQEVTEKGLLQLEEAMEYQNEPIEIVTHAELLEHCGDGDICNIRTIHFTTLPYEGVSNAITALLDADDNEEERDIILDVDLDGFATTSPGAIALLQTAIPDYDVLTRIYHTVHDGEICDMDVEYWKRLSSGETEELCQSNDLSFVHGPSFRPSPDDDGNSLAHRVVSDQSRALVESLYFHYKMDETVVTALGEVLEYYLPAIQDAAYDDEKFVEIMDVFLYQPFYVSDEATIQPLIGFHHDFLKDVFDTSGSGNSRRSPKVVNIVRSPFYTPDHHLDFIECEVFGRMLDMFGRGSGIYHSEEVDVDRTRCLQEKDKFPPELRFNIGENPHIQVDQWLTIGHNAYSWFFEDDDDHFSTGYKTDPIEVDFVNEHKETLSLSIGDKIITVPQGQRVTEKVYHLTKWELLFAANDSNSEESIRFNGKHGERQSYGSITGRIPVHNKTPVRMEVQNPSYSRIAVEIRSIEYDIKTTISPGDIETHRTFHGHRFSIHNASNEDFEQIGEVIANATHGDTHSVLLFEDNSNEL